MLPKSWTFSWLSCLQPWGTDQEGKNHAPVATFPRLRFLIFYFLIPKALGKHQSFLCYLHTNNNGFLVLNIWIFNLLLSFLFLEVQSSLWMADSWLIISQRNLEEKYVCKHKVGILFLYFVLLMKSHLQSYPCPLQINTFWNLGFLLGITIILQIITGIFLGLHYTSDLNNAYSSIFFFISIFYSKAFIL